MAKGAVGTGAERPTGAFARRRARREGSTGARRRWLLASIATRGVPANAGASVTCSASRPRTASCWNLARSCRPRPPRRLRARSVRSTAGPRARAGRAGDREGAKARRQARRGRPPRCLAGSSVAAARGLSGSDRASKGSRASNARHEQLSACGANAMRQRSHSQAQSESGRLGGDRAQSVAAGVVLRGLCCARCGCCCFCRRRLAATCTRAVTAQCPRDRSRCPFRAAPRPHRAALGNRRTPFSHRLLSLRGWRGGPTGPLGPARDATPAFAAELLRSPVRVPSAPPGSEVGASRWVRLRSRRRGRWSAVPRFVAACRRGFPSCSNPAAAFGWPAAPGE